MKILVVDDDKGLNRGICTFLNTNNYETQSVFDGKDGLSLLLSNKFDFVLSDLQMPEMDGLTLLEKMKENNINIPFVIMTAFASVENAVEAMKNGAEDYLTKPVNLKELIIKIEKILKSRKLIEENYALKNKIRNYEMPEIIGESEAIFELKKMLRRISSDSNVPVYIYGKSGTGKELVAHNIHFMSQRKDKPFVPINCATLSDELMESELFGYRKGAFTGAIQNKVGLIENCDGGTIFLDEISEMSPRVQSKLLRVLQNGVIQAVGSNEMKKIDVRFICASNQELSILVEQKKFREDLYFRLNVIEIEVPSLASRKSDIPILIDHFFNKYEKSDFRFSDESIELLINYDWPGNIRELENLIRYEIVTSTNSIIESEYLPKKFHKNNTIKFEQNENFDDEYKIAFSKNVTNFDKAYIQYHLKKNDFNVSQTAEEINLSRVSLHKKIKEYSIQQTEDK
jgi:DNA-binding NtrC family response regulator